LEILLDFIIVWAIKKIMIVMGLDNKLWNEESKYRCKGGHLSENY
jgi:hypothetical protein